MKRHLVYLYIVFKTKRYKKYCGFKNGTCINGIICCTGCKHLKNNKCNISCVHCKIWFCVPCCQTMTKRDYKYVNKLYDLASKYGLLAFREPYRFKRMIR